MTINPPSVLKNKGVYRWNYYLKLVEQFCFINYKFGYDQFFFKETILKRFTRKLC